MQYTTQTRICKHTLAQRHGIDNGTFVQCQYNESPISLGYLFAMSIWRRVRSSCVHHVRKVEVMLRRASLVVLVPLLLHVGIVSIQESYLMTYVRVKPPP